MRPREVEIAFSAPAHPLAVTWARRLLSNTIEVLGGGHDETDACIVTSELVANAIRHSEGDVRVRFRVSDDNVHIEVRDDGLGEPEVLDPDPSCEVGRGLLIVSNLAESWGWEPVDGGKAVWADLALDHARRGAGVSI